jgi:hypothetical protein
MVLSKEAYAKCLGNDIGYSRIESMIKNRKNLAEVKEIIAANYP